MTCPDDDKTDPQEGFQSTSPGRLLGPHACPLSAHYVHSGCVRLIRAGYGERVGQKSANS